MIRRFTIAIVLVVAAVLVALPLAVAVVLVALPVAANTWGDEFEACLAKSAYQNALSTHGWDSPEELAAWYACMDAADTAANVEVVVLPAEVDPVTPASYSAGNTVPVTTTNAETEELEYETVKLTDYEAALMNCSFGLEPPQPVLSPPDVDGSQDTISECVDFYWAENE